MGSTFNFAFQVAIINIFACTRLITKGLQLQFMDREFVLHTLSFLKSAPADFQKDFFDKSMPASVPAGSFICMESNHCMHLPIVLKGEARVYKASDEGKELTLYRIEAGESCILTASCILNQIVFPANAIATTDVEALVVSTKDVKAWMSTYPSWQQYIFGLISLRFASVIELVEEVAFQRMDARLISYLREASVHTGTIKTTHEAIATDLGTSREVISRLLKDFEHKGLVSLARGTINITRPEAFSS